LILFSHHIPEDYNDVKNKIKYFKAVKDAILKTRPREEFKKYSIKSLKL
jgi:hypothetical protein